MVEGNFPRTLDIGSETMSDGVVLGDRYTLSSLKSRE